MRVKPGSKLFKAVVQILCVLNITPGLRVWERNSAQLRTLMCAEASLMSTDTSGVEFQTAAVFEHGEHVYSCRYREC